MGVVVVNGYTQSLLHDVVAYQMTIEVLKDLLRRWGDETHHDAFLTLHQMTIFLLFFIASSPTDRLCLATARGRYERRPMQPSRSIVSYALSFLCISARRRAYVPKQPCRALSLLFRAGVRQGPPDWRRLF